MSEFEFVQVTIAIILGLGITAILKNIGEQIRNRELVAIYPLQLYAASILVVVILRYLWILWSMNDIQWNLTLFLLASSSPIALALASQVVCVDCDSTTTPREQYFANGMATFCFWASAPFFQFVFYQVLSDPSIAIQYTAFIVIGLLVSLGFIKKPAYHWSVLTFLLVTLILGTVFTQFELSGG